MIYVTHDQVEAMTLADRIVVLRAGRIEQVGTPAQLYADPDNVFVAGFIGSPKMNLIDATSDGQTLSVGGIDLVVPNLTLPSGKLTIGIRPEQFDEPASSPHGFTVTAQVVENLGGTSIVHGALPDGQIILIEQRGQTRTSTGETLRCTFDPARILVFDAEGQRVKQS